MNRSFVVSEDVRRWGEAQQLFDQALELPMPERAAFVHANAADDTWLVQTVLELLALDEESSPLDHFDASIEALPTLKTGDSLGKYRLLERLGEGGMGAVYRAERFGQGVRYEVALKVLRGSWSTAARQRFVQEQRILAELHHPRIVRLLDFGATADGFVYLVMNRVSGTSLTDYADRERLSVSARIRLFLQICEAVHHAHERLIVHRDLKPANILVDADGSAHLLDFGIAKMLDPGAHLGGQATQPELRAMTPSYASPEQLLYRTVTTRTDIWALGVLLFELLTGQRPYDWSGMDLSAIEKRLEVEPRPKASSVFLGEASLLGGESAQDRAARRASTPAALRRKLRGDLDLVLMKALAPRPEDRYSSVTAFAQDLRRYLEEMPVLAHGPSWRYDAGKFLRRHALVVTATVALMVSLAGFSLQQNAQARQLMAERDMARQQEEKASLLADLVSDVLESASPARSRPAPAVRALLAQSEKRILADLETQPDIRLELLIQIGRLYRNLGDYEKAEILLTQVLDSWEGSEASHGWAQTLNELGRIYYMRRDPRDIPTLRRAVQSFWRLHGGDHSDLASALGNLANALNYDGEHARALALQRLAVAMDERLGLASTPEAGARLTYLAGITGRLGDRAPALALLDRASEVLTAHWGQRSVPVALVLNRKARLHLERPYAQEATRLLEEARSIFVELLDKDHPLVAGAHHNLAIAYQMLGDFEAAERAEREAWRLDRQRLGPEHPSTLSDRRILALILCELGRDVEAEEHFRGAMEGSERVHEAGHPLLLLLRNDFARWLIERGLLDEAAEQLDEALVASSSARGKDHWLTGVAYVGRAELALHRNQLETAIRDATEAVHILQDEKKAELERWRLGEARSALGQALILSGRQEEGLTELRAAVEFLQLLVAPTARATRQAEARLRAAESKVSDPRPAVRLNDSFTSGVADVGPVG